jgi:hypothetical protein
MAYPEPIHRPRRLAWPTVLQLAEPTEVIDIWADGRVTYFVVLARLVDGRYAVWSQAESSGIRCTEAEIFDSRETAKEALDALARTVVDCANAHACVENHVHAAGRCREPS